MAGIGEVVSSDNFLGGALIIGGLLIGAYGQAGKFQLVTAFGILCVMAGSLAQFMTAAGQGEGVSRRGATTVAFIFAVLLGVLLLGAGLRRRNSLLAGVALFLGILVLLASAFSLLLAILSINGPLGTFD